MHQPVVWERDEAGKVVYKLGNYMAPRFEEIFHEIDNDLPRLGIRSYRIKNMTLEQVFVASGEQEGKADEQDQGGVRDSQVLVSDLPHLETPGFCG